MQVLLSDRYRNGKMDGKDNLNDQGRFLLRECYELALNTEKIDIAREVLTEKIIKTGIPDGYIPGHTESTKPESEMEVLSEVLYSLALEQFGDPETGTFTQEYKLNGLHDSGEKRYLQALLSLRSGTGVAQRTEAIKHLTEALRQSPANPVFIALSKVLQDADV